MAMHMSHPGIITRPKRAEGHLTAVLQMFDDRRSCLDLAQQLHAVEKAVANAKRELIQDHIEHCLDGSCAGGSLNTKAALRELKALARYL